MLDETKNLSEQTDDEPLTPQTADIVRDVFAVVSDQSKVLSQQLHEFNARKQQLDQEISRGARRTSGRIV